MKFEDRLSEVLRLTEQSKKALKKLGIITVRDLLYHFPSRYITVADVKFVKDLVKGDHALMYGKITKLKTSKAHRTKMTMAEGTFEDDTGSIQIVWFNQPYIAKMLKEGVFVKMEGKVAEKATPKGRSGAGKLYITNPEYETIVKLPKRVGNSLWGESFDSLSIPVYPERFGITSKWIYHTVQKIFNSGILETLEDPIPKDILNKYNLPEIQKALIWMHTPKKDSHSTAARKRFAFEEVFFIQLEKQREKKEYQKEPSYIIEPNKKTLDEFVSRFPFTPTKGQNNAIKEIINDISTPSAMSRLLEGDVGSGKTAVAACTTHAVVTTRPLNANGKRQDFGHLQVAYMAPTEILAKQHFESFIQYFRHMPIQIGLITSSGCRKFPSKVSPEGHTDISRAQLLKWTKNGEIAVLIGTHSLISKSVEFENLAYVIIDEQHRFGINQRKKLTRKEGGPLPHLLSMTATPIPRTLALTIYGDLDLTLLDEMPKGRKTIITEIVPPTKRKEVYENIRGSLKEGRQAYVICPRIDEPDPDKENALQLKSVNEEAKRLKKEVFQEYEIGVLHGKMKPKEKDKIMLDFLEHKIDILVATSVVEVGVNVPNSTTIVIEGADRFGLAQLHQLRGRVVRSNHQAYCYVFTDSPSKKTFERLSALKKAKNGFELAEHDLMLRGSGELSGTRQWGISDIAMEALKNIKMVEAARAEARAIIESDSTLKKHPKLKNILESKKQIHFE